MRAVADTGPLHYLILIDHVEILAALFQDDRAGVAAARLRNFAVTGTVGLLVLAARRNLLDLPADLDALDRSNFRWSPSLRARVLANFATQRSP